MPEIATQARSRLLYRVVVVLILAVVAWQSVTATISAVTRRHQPSAALRLQPFDAIARGQLASNLQTDPQRRASPQQLDQLARGALLRDPTDAQSARVLGFNESMRRQNAKALRLMEYAESLTRRDLATELWLIEHYVHQNDIPKVLQRYEAAASTSRSAMPVLFPILVNALNEHQIVAPMVDMIAQEPWWTDSFLLAVARDTRSTDNVAELFLGLARRGHPPRADIADIVVARMQREGKAEEAARLRTMTRGRPGPVTPPGSLAPPA